MIALLYFLSLFTSLLEAEEHAIYVSVIDMEIVDHEISMTVKVFEDDLRDALRSINGEVYHQLTEDDLSDVSTYFDNHLEVGSTCESIKLECTHIRLEGESYQLDFEGKKKIDCQFSSIRADHLMELFGDQRNILNLTKDGKKQFEILDKKKPEVTIKGD